MLAPASLFRLLSELVFVLLGALLVWVAWTGQLLWNRRSAVWLGLGAFLVYWGLRAWWQADRAKTRRELAAETVRGISLALVGALMLGIAWLPFPWIAVLLGAAGGVLVVRGIFTAALVLRSV